MRWRRFLVSVVLVFLVLLTALVAAESPPVIHEVTKESNQNDCLYYFASEECTSCSEVEKEFKRLELGYPGIKLHRFEVYYQPDNSRLLQDLFDSYQVPQDAQSIPAVFIGKTYLVGKSSIINLLEGRIMENAVNECPSIMDESLLGVVGKGRNPSDVILTLNFLSITSAALSDAFRPGMIALLLILMGLLSAVVKDETLVKRGALFILVVYGLYVFTGLNVFPTVSEGLAQIFYKIIGFAAIILSFVWIKSFFTTWKAFVRSFPAELRDRAKMLRELAVSPGGFVLFAILGSFFAITRTHKTFSVIQNLSLVGGYSSNVVPLLLFYSLVTVIPLIVVVVLYYAAHTKGEEKAEENAKVKHKVKKWRTHYHKVINFFAGCAMLVIGLILLFA